MGSVNVRLKAISSGQSILTSPATPRPRMRPTLSTVSALAISIFFGSQPRSAQVPPVGRKSMIATVQPAARDRIAATIAAVPVPTITRSYSLVLTFLQRLRPGAGLIKTHASPSGRPHQSWTHPGPDSPALVRECARKHREHALGAKGSGR